VSEPSIIERSAEKAHYLHALRDRLHRVAEDAMLDGETDASCAVSAVAGVLRRHVSAGEIDDIRALLPEDLEPILG
jgi:uncharacterized protein (DUF2267 family)